MYTDPEPLSVYRRYSFIAGRLVEDLLIVAMFPLTILFLLLIVELIGV